MLILLFSPYRYVRESGCEPSKTLTSSRFARDLAAVGMDADILPDEVEVEAKQMVMPESEAAAAAQQVAAQPARKGKAHGAGTSVGTVAVVGLVALVVLAAAAATIASMAGTMVRRKGPGPGPGDGGAVVAGVGSAEGLGLDMGTCGLEKVKHL